MTRFSKFITTSLAIAFCSISLSSAVMAESKAPQFLFVQSAESMTFKGDLLTLKNVTPMTIFFSDRPKRLAGHMRTGAFVSHWNKGTNSFKKDPPNGTLSVFNPKTQATEAVVELTDPQLDGNNIAYKVKVLFGKLPAQGGESSLFIDSSDGACDVGDGSYSGEPCWAQNAFNCGDRGGC